jgi:hypothetical protein
MDSLKKILQNSMMQMTTTATSVFVEQAASCHSFAVGMMTLHPSAVEFVRLVGGTFRTVQKQRWERMKRMMMTMMMRMMKMMMDE